MVPKCSCWLPFCVVIFVVKLWGYVNADPQVPCFFIFGDSLVDNGNNNNIVSFARADYTPYGIDFPGRRPTGRFTNDRTTVDFLAEHLGFNEYIPPYVQVSGGGRNILRGVNYASAAGGIRDETGQQLGGRISFSGQVRNYRNTVSQIVEELGGEEQAADYLGQCIFSIGLGSNDYLNNYFMPMYYTTSRRFTPEQYADALIQEYAQNIRALRECGARKFAFIAVGQIGCAPFELASRSPDGRTCDEQINSATRLFNDRLQGLVNQFNSEMPDTRVTYLNVPGIFQNLLDNPGAYGFRVTNAGCCGIGRNNGQIRCLPFQPVCPNRDEYVYFDAFHPTDAANAIVARRSYNAESSSDASPFDIQTLARA